MRIKITISYDGTCYCGWQVQKNGLSIQVLVQKSLETILRHPIDLTGAGRTDAGVHALGQTAHFDTFSLIDLNRLRYSTNALLPPDIRIIHAEEVSDNFHARYSATGKIYHYHIQLDPVSDPMTRLYRYQVFGSFDCAALRQAAPLFIGTHDFINFANEPHKGSAAHDSIRTLKRLDIMDEPGGIRLEFEGDGFLYKMVRNLTGVLIDIAAGRRSSMDIFKPRKTTVPANGLFLVKVNYSPFKNFPSGIFSNDSKCSTIPCEAISSSG